MSNTRTGWSCVYVLQSVVRPDRFYVGLTDDLAGRLARHNRGEVPSTRAGAPWEMRNAFGFRDRARAAAFERYLKSGSGRAFARRHF
ncbi:MAG: GIY-YIG nuclease family protein [Verrucomicrobiota bacterium]